MTCTDDDTIRVVECYMEDCLVFSEDVIGECSVTCGGGMRIDVINGIKRVYYQNPPDFKNYFLYLLINFKNFLKFLYFIFIYFLLSLIPLTLTLDR